jgi:hypothetical protein
VTAKAARPLVGERAGSARWRSRSATTVPKSSTADRYVDAASRFAQRGSGAGGQRCLHTQLGRRSCRCRIRAASVRSRCLRATLMPPTKANAATSREDLLRARTNLSEGPSQPATRMPRYSSNRAMRTGSFAQFVLPLAGLISQHPRTLRASQPYATGRPGGTFMTRSWPFSTVNGAACRQSSACRSQACVASSFRGAPMSGMFAFGECPREPLATVCCHPEPVAVDRD